VSDDSTAVLPGQLERASAGDDEARQRLLELTRGRLMRHARRFLHGGYARLEPLAQFDDVVQQLHIGDVACIGVSDAARLRYLAHRAARLGASVALNAAYNA
jgi:hypothetical protein